MATGAQDRDLMEMVPEDLKEPLRAAVRHLQSLLGQFSGPLVPLRTAIDHLKGIAPDVPGMQQVNELTRQVETFDTVLRDSLSDDSQLAQQGCLQQCKPWYINSVKTRLQEYAANASQVVNGVRSLDTSFVDSVKSGVDSLQEAVPSKLQGLQEIPDIVQQAVERSLHSLSDLEALPNTIAQIKERLNVRGLLAPVSLAAAHVRAQAIPALENSVRSLDTFIDSSPRQIDRAFGLPAPWTPFQPIVTRFVGRPPAQQRLFDSVTAVSRVMNIQPAVDALHKVGMQLQGLNVEYYEGLINSYSTRSLEVLDHLGSAATIASQAARAAQTGQQGYDMLQQANQLTQQMTSGNALQALGNFAQNTSWH
eukprot:m.111851 g.111851  ORF g.111851 m.111851 type:complete len:365 (-) comp16142_c0_seq2:3332-4426(-)